MSLEQVQQNLSSEWPRPESFAPIDRLRLVDAATERSRSRTTTAAPSPVAGRALRRGGAEGQPSVVTGPSTFDNISGLFQTYESLAYMVPFEMLDFIEMLAIYNPDYSQAVENMRTLANPGHVLLVDATKGVAKDVAMRIDQKNRQIQHRHGGVDGIIDKLLWQAAVYGAMCGEYVANESMTDIVDFIDVNPKTIRFFWEDDPAEDPFEMGPHYAPYQYATFRQLEIARANGQKVNNGAYVKLNEVTFQYFSFGAAPGSPYGVPPFLAALNNIAIQRDMMGNMAKVVKKIALLGIIDIKVDSLKVLPNESQDQYRSRATQYLEGYADLAADMLDSGGIIHFDDATVDSETVAGNAAGATNIFTQNEEQVFSGLKSMPSVQGRNYCVVPETKVLTADLKWVDAGKLSLGDELIGFDEDLGKGNSGIIDPKPSVVEVNKLIKLPCVKITTDYDEITVSAQHPLVVKDIYQEDNMWLEAREIVPGDRLLHYNGLWDVEGVQDGRTYAYVAVTKVERVGVKEVVALQTSSRTFISEGFLSHNSTTETYAGVSYDIMIRQSLRYQHAAKMMIEYGYNLMTLLWGTKVNSVKIKFRENKSLQRYQTAQAEHTEILNQLMLWASGITNQVDAAHALGRPDVDTPLDQVPNSPWFASGGNPAVTPPYEESPPEEDADPPKNGNNKDDDKDDEEDQDNEDKDDEDKDDDSKESNKNV